MCIYPGEGVKALREMHDMSIDTLSGLTKIDRQRLIDIENSEENICLEDATILARALKTFPGLLLSWNRET